MRTSLNFREVRRHADLRTGTSLGRSAGGASARGHLAYAVAMGATMGATSLNFSERARTTTERKASSARYYWT